MKHQHAVVWVDHREAHVLGFGTAGVDRTVLHSHHDEQQIHRKANSIGSGRAPNDTEFFERVAAAMRDFGAILLTGPAGAKLELMEHLRASHPAVAKAVSAVEPADHPSEGELLARARAYFKAADRLVR